MVERGHGRGGRIIDPAPSESVDSVMSVTVIRVPLIARFVTVVKHSSWRYYLHARVGPGRKPDRLTPTGNCEAREVRDVGVTQDWSSPNLSGGAAHHLMWALRRDAARVVGASKDVGVSRG